MAVSLSDSPPSQGPCCPVCFRDYSDNESDLIPRILQCGHTYCTECLDKLLNIDQEEDEYQQVVLNIRYAGREWTTTRNYPRAPYTSNELKCPTCKAINLIQNRDISSLTKNFALLGCRPNTSGGTPQRNKHFCKDHDHEKRIYCSDCKTLICAYCQLYGGHRGHHYIVASEASQPSIESLKLVDGVLTEDLSSLSSGESSLNLTISRLSKTRSKCEKSVKTYFGDAITKLERQKDLLLSQIASWTDEQMYILKAQLDMLTTCMKEIKTVQSSCQSLIAGDPLDALTQQQEVEKDVDSLHERLSEISLGPLINPWMRAKEEAGCDEALNALVSNFKLSYDADTLGGDREVEGGAADEPSANESDSSMDSLMGGSAGLSNVLEVYRMQSIENRRAVSRHNNSDNEETSQGGRAGQVYSQETQAMPDFPPVEGAVGLQRSEHAPGHDMNWLSNPPTSSFPFGRRVICNRAGLSGLLEDSGSNSEADHSPRDDEDYMQYRRSRHRRLLHHGHVPRSSDMGGQPGGIDLSSDDDSECRLEDILERHQSHALGTSVVTGVESVLDSLEIRRHWDFLNGGRAGRSAATAHETGESSKEEEEEEEEGDSVSLHMVPMFPEGQSAHSDYSSSSPTAHPGPPGPLSDFAYPHRLSLPVGSGRDPDDEVVFPSTPHYSWTNQQDGRGRAFQVNVGSGALLQLSIQPDASSDREEAGSDLEPDGADSNSEM